MTEAEVEDVSSMTLLQMLDVLEGGIVGLRADRERLATALSGIEQQLNGGAAKARAKRKKPARRKVVKRSKPKQEAAPPPEVEAPAAPPPRRRQALGMTLAQLRAQARREPAAASADAVPQP